MAHDIHRNILTGRDSFYSLREAAWHKLGQVVDKPVTDPECLRLAGLDWNADKVPLITAQGDMVETHCAVKRSDTGSILGVVGTGFECFQNAEMLDYLRDLGQGTDMTIETAGALGTGEVVWALAKIPGLEIVFGKDRTESYFILTQGHAGTKAMTACPTMIRVVCANTMRMMHEARSASNKLTAGYTLRHTSGLRGRMDEAKRVYQNAIEDHAKTKTALAALVATRSSPVSLPAILNAAYPIRPDENGDEGQRARTMRLERERTIAKIRRSETCNVEGTEGTVYSDYQAVTEYIDHESITDAAKRFASTQFGGAGDDAKGRAWEAALALV